MTEVAQPASDRVPWRPRLVRVVAALMATILVAAMDSTIVATALPTLTGELGGFALYPWVISSYLLTGTTSVPVWGRLADLHGRKNVLLAGLAIFVTASVMCGAAPTMPALIVFRALQGIGAGCLVPVAFTTIGDIFPVAQRARLQGLFSSVWATAALAGPLLGSVFVSTIGWRWIFFVNLPLGLLAAGLLRSFEERRDRGDERGIDYRGAALLTAGVAALLAGLGAGHPGAEPAWWLVVAGAILLGLFAIAERRSQSPTLPLQLLRNPLIGPSTLAALLAGTVMFSLNAYLPLYVQGFQGGTAYQAGAVLGVASITWSLASITLGRALVRIGHQPLMVSGGVFMTAGAGLLLASPFGPGLIWAALCSGLIGFGMGQILTPVLIVIQGAVPWSLRGSVTALNQFSRTIGGAVGVSLLGLLLQSRLVASALASGISPGALAHPLSSRGGVAPGLRPALGDGLQAVFWVLFVLAAGALLTSLAILGADRRARAAVAPAGAE